MTALGAQASEGLDPSSLAPSILQVVDGDGTFNEDAVQHYMHSSGVDSTGVEYTVVAIMGPQSSGKSTLLNALFGTNFQEMDALSGRKQTTHGVWLAPAPRISNPLTLVMDLEGSDGRERGEDDTGFERRSALFALAVADVVVVNMWAKDVGREAGAGKPLLKTILQVNLKLFHPTAAAGPRTVLLFVFRDRTRTPLDLLRSTWEADLERLWEGMAKPPGLEGLPLSDFFEVQYAALANYEDRPDDFRAETHLLRRRFCNDDSETLLRPLPNKLPGAALALSMSKVWEVVRENRDLNLPAHRVMVANLRCEELAEACLADFLADADWQALAAENDVTPGFGWRVSDRLDEALQNYDEEARYFDPEVSAAKRAGLKEDLLDVVRPVYVAQLDALRGLALAGFQAQLVVPREEEAWTERVSRLETEALAMFDSTAPDLAVRAAEDAWDGATVGARDALRAGVASEAGASRAAAVASALEEAQGEAADAVGAAAGPLFDAAPSDLWQRCGAAVDAARDAAAAGLERALAGYGVGAAEGLVLMGGVEGAARARLLASAREAAHTALSRLRDRFHDRFSRDEAGLPRAWTPRSDVAGAAAAARGAAAQLLALLAVVGLERPGAPSPRATAKSGATRAAVVAIEALADGGGKKAAVPGPAAGAAPALDATTAAQWTGLDPEDVLLPPPAVRAVWRQFASDSAIAVQQAAATREANRLAAARGPPLWAIAAMAVLGFNEAVAVIRNPLWLLILLLLFLFARTVYNELDVEGEMANGLLPGALAVAAKFWPTLKRVVARSVEAARKFLAEDGEGGEAPQAGGKPAATQDPVAVVKSQTSQSSTTLRSRAAPVVTQPSFTREVEMTEYVPEEEEGAAGLDEVADAGVVAEAPAAEEPVAEAPAAQAPAGEEPAEAPATELEATPTEALAAVLDEADAAPTPAVAVEEVAEQDDTDVPTESRKDR